MISLPSADEIAQLGYHRGGRGRGANGVPMIADDEAVCQVRVLETGSGAYWSRGDVDVHVLDAKQRGFRGEAFLSQGWLAQALRERRQERLRLQRGGVQTTATGLMVLNPRAQLILP
jgi:hypothetical protein